MEKQISIIIPCYNIQDYIKRCVDSIENALIGREKEYEIILIDDGSKDKTGDICDELTKIYSNIVCKHKENGGSSSARNAGMNLAQGKYIVFVDGDDCVSSEMIKIFEEIQDVYDVISFGYMVSDGKNIVEIKNNRKLDFKKFNHPEKIKYYKTKHFENVWTYLYKRSFLENNKLMFTNGVYYEDVEFLSRVFFYAKSLKSSNLCYYVYNDSNLNSVTRSMKLRNYIDFFTVLNLMVSFADENITDKKYYKTYRQCYSRIFYGLLINHNKLKRQYKNEIENLFVKYKYLKKFPKGFKNNFLNCLITIFGIKFVYRMVLCLSKMVGK